MLPSSERGVFLKKLHSIKVRPGGKFDAVDVRGT
jgi:hypothetical protein